MSLSHDTLKALHEAATPGEWRLAGKCVPECWMTENEEGDFIAQCQDRRGFASLDAVGNNALIAYLCSESTRTEILNLIAERDAMRGAIRTVIARCEALEDEACDGLTDASTEHAQGWWRGQKSTAKSIRRELHGLIAYLCSESTRTEILNLIAERDAMRGECIGQAVEDEAKRLWDATPTSGSQDYYGCEWSELSERSRDKFRLQALGEFRARAALGGNHHGS